MITTTISVVPERLIDIPWISKLSSNHWGSTKIVSIGKTKDIKSLPAFVATAGGKRIGFLSYEIRNNACEVVALASIQKRIGIGSELIATIVAYARQTKCTRIWLVTTNDNLTALRFFQKRGFKICAVHPNALEKTRELKPEIPAIGLHGIPIRDEIELEMII